MAYRLEIVEPETSGDAWKWAYRDLRDPEACLDGEPASSIFHVFRDIIEHVGSVDAVGFRMMQPVLAIELGKFVADFEGSFSRNGAMRMAPGFDETMFFIRSFVDANFTFEASRLTEYLVQFPKLIHERPLARLPDAATLMDHIQENLRHDLALTLLKQTMSPVQKGFWSFKVEDVSTHLKGDVAFLERKAVPLPVLTGTLIGAFETTTSVEVFDRYSIVFDDLRDAFLEIASYSDAGERKTWVNRAREVEEQKFFIEWIDSGFLRV